MWSVTEVELPGRGIGLVAARDIQAGETVLVDEPLLLFVQPAFAAHACAQCLRMLSADGAAASCSSCNACRFCCAACAAAAALPGGAHSPELCAALRALAQSPLDAEARPAAHARALVVCTLMSPRPPQQAQHLARFLLQLYSLKAAGACSAQAAAQFRAFTQLSSLAVAPASPEAQLALAVQPLLRAAFVDTGRLRPEEMSVEEIAVALAIEAANGFCIMAAADAEGGRRVRGSGVYLRSSRINHACFPNVARFDYFDAPGDASRCLQFRALDPIPQGAEIVMSYFPISLPRAERQQRLLNDYGFSCSCTRCEQEGVGSAGMIVGDDTSFSSSDGDSSDGAEDWEQGGDGYSVEYSLWMLKFLCPKEGCGGTLAPPTTTAVVMECNYCGYERTDAEFYEALEAPC